MITSRKRREKYEARLANTRAISYAIICHPKQLRGTNMHCYRNHPGDHSTILLIFYQLAREPLSKLKLFLTTDSDITKIFLDTFLDFF
jgi:hypothetical protein